MAVSKQEIVLEVKVDNTKGKKGADDVKKSVENASDATDALSGSLDRMTGGAVSAFTSVGKSIGKTVGGLKTLKGALAATGIGLLVVAIGSLITAFKSSEEGANKLSKILGVVGSVTDNLLDLVADLGEKIIAVFENPQEAFQNFKDALVNNITNRLEGLLEFLPAIGEAISLVFSGKFGEAAKTAGDAVAKVALGVEDFSDKAADAVQASQDFAQQLIDEGKIAATIADQRAKANKLERELLVDRAQLESEIAGLRLKSRQEEEFSAEERKQAILEAQALEDQLLAKETEVLTLRRDAQIEENKLARSSVENLNKEAEAVAAVGRQEAARLTQQRATQRELNRLNKEIERDAKAAAKAEEDKKKAEQKALDDKLAAEEKARQDQLAAQQKLEDELFALSLSAQEREELALQQVYDQRIAIAGDDEGLIKAATERYLADQAALEEKYAGERVEREKISAQAVVESFQNAFNAIQALQEAFGGQNEKQARRNFKIQKALSLAQTTIGTVEGVQNAFTTAQKSPITALFPGYPFVQAGIAGAFGAAQLAVIGKSKYEGGSTTPPPPPPDGGGGGGAPAGGGQTQAPQLDLSFLGEGAGQEGPIQAYVVSENVSNAQQANQKIQEQASL